jgi:hypothetical protein
LRAPHGLSRFLRAVLHPTLSIHSTLLPYLAGWPLQTIVVGVSIEPPLTRGTNSHVRTAEGDRDRASVQKALSSTYADGFGPGRDDRTGRGQSPRFLVAQHDRSAFLCIADKVGPSLSRCIGTPSLNRRSVSRGRRLVEQDLGRMVMTKGSFMDVVSVASQHPIERA